MSSHTSWTFRLLTIICGCTCVVGIPTTVNISVPDGTSNHGDPNLLCTPTKWTDVFTFFAANYVAHAATVKTLPGEKTLEVVFTLFLAICFPFSGVARGLEAILRHASFGANDLTTAARAGALCFVVRTKDWIPRGNNIQIKGLRAADSFVLDLQNEKTPSIIHMVRDKDELMTENLLYQTEGYRIRKGYRLSREVHGIRRLPAGYTLYILPSNAVVIPDIKNRSLWKRGCEHRMMIADEGVKGLHESVGQHVLIQEKPLLASSYSIPQIIIAIFQVLYASYSLYQSRGDQLNRYGYAAFGLTVIPYIIMSFMNLLGNLLTPDYPLLYLVHSSVLDEAILAGAEVDGIVGKLEESYDDFEDRFTGIFEGGLLKLQWEGEQPKVVEISAAILPDREFATDDGVSVDRRETIFFPAYSPFKKDGSPYKGPRALRGRLRLFWWAFTSFFLGAIPYGTIGGLTHFQRAQSTQIQQVFTMFWLASGVFIGAAIPFYKFSIYEMVTTALEFRIRYSGWSRGDDR